MVYVEPNSSFFTKLEQIKNYIEQSLPYEDVLYILDSIKDNINNSLKNGYEIANIKEEKPIKFLINDYADRMKMAEILFKLGYTVKQESELQNPDSRYSKENHYIIAFKETVNEN
jgi:hypothetical protein